MEVKILKKEKNELIFEIDNVTLAEVLRVYLSRDSAVEFVAWKKEHLTKSPIFKLRTSGKDAKKVLDAGINLVIKEADKLLEDFKKMK